MLRPCRWNVLAVATAISFASATALAQTQAPFAIATIEAGDATGDANGVAVNDGVETSYSCGGPGGATFPILINSPPDIVDYVQPGSITAASSCNSTQGATGTVTASTSPGNVATGSGSVSASVDGINESENSSSTSALFELVSVPNNLGSTPVEVRLTWGPPGNENVQMAPTYNLTINCLGPGESLPTQCSPDLPATQTLAASGSIDQVLYLAPGTELAADISVNVDLSDPQQGVQQSITSAGQYTMTLSLSGQQQSKSLGPCPCQNPALAGEPVNVATGNEFQTETDYLGSSGNSIALRRWYNSQSTASGMFGANWSSSYESAIRQVDADTVQAARPDGRVETFGLLSGAWQADPDITDRLTAVASGWQLTAPDDSVETYDSSGRLVSVATRAGLVTTLNYDAGGRLASVTSPFGHVLTFAYDDSGRVSAATTPGGGVFTYSYDGSGNLISVEYPDSSKKQYLYENSGSPHELTGIIDQDGARFATIAYDTQGRAVSTQHAGGVDLTTITYNEDGSTQITDANGNAHGYALATQYGVGKPEGVSGTPCLQCGGQAFTYDQDGFLASRTDWDGNVTTYLNDARGREVERTEAAGTPLARTIVTAWDQTFHLPDAIEKPNRVTEYSYDSTGNLLRKTEFSTVTAPAPPRVWSYAYDRFGHVLTAKGPRTDVTQLTTYTYDAHGDLSAATDALGHTTGYPSYDADGRLLESIDPNGLTTQLTYDGLGRLTSRNVGGLVTSYTYDPAGQLTKIAPSDGSFVAMTYDAAHRLTQVADSFGNYIVYTLDAMGNRIREQGFDASGYLLVTHSSTYNSLNLVAQSIGAQGQTTAYQYDNNGNETAVTDPLGQITRIAYDALNRRVSSEDPMEATTTYGYDANDDLTSVEDARGLTTQYTYDGLVDDLAISSPDTGVTQMTYDGAGNVATRTDAGGRLASYSYDALNRVTQIRYSGTTSTNFGYDQGPNGIGHLTGMSDASGSTRWSYDQQGRVIDRSQTVAATTLVTQYAYDPDGRLASITYPSGAVIQYGYTANVISQISVNGAPVLSNIAYRGFRGPVAGWTWGNGTTYTRSFDADGRLDGYPLGSRTRQLTYDAAGRITAYTDSDPTRSESFGYDPANRLTQYSAAGGAETYGYDAVGNRTSLTNSFPGAANTAYTYSASSNQLIGLQTGTQSTTAYSYDPTGNLVGDGVNHFVYDARNRLIEASNAQGLTYYAINGLGQRVAKLSGPPPDLAGDANHDGVLNATDLRLIGLMITHAIPIDLAADCNHDGQITTADVACVQSKIAAMRLNPQNYVSPTGTVFAYDEAGHLLGEYGANGTIDETVYLGGMPVVVLEGGSVYSVYTDQVDAPSVMASSNNSLVWDWEGEPFGNVPANQNPSGLGTVRLNLRFPGQYFDAETGLHYNMARDYSPGTGRYVESDPKGLDGGINTYGYAAAQPVTGLDPTGLDNPSASNAGTAPPIDCGDIRNMEACLGIPPQDTNPITSGAPEECSKFTNWLHVLESYF